MNVDFYTFSKRINSTAQPTGGASYSCVLKSASSVTAPRISLVWGGTGNPSAYNYAYIADYGRFYWVNNWTFADRQWTAELSVDVLATYKSQIGAASKYVLRAAADYDYKVIDRLYPAKADNYYAVGTGSWGFSTLSVGGVYIIGVIGAGNTYTAGGVGLYQADTGQAQTIIANAYNAMNGIINSRPAVTTPSSVEDGLKLLGNIADWLGDAVIRCTGKVSDFLTSLMWFPFAFPGGSQVSVNLGLVTSGGTAQQLTGLIYSHDTAVSLSGLYPGLDLDAWKNIAPFASFYVEAPPFGIIELDTLDLWHFTGLRLNLRVDALSGGGLLRIYGTATGQTDVLLAQRTAQVGVSIPLAGNAIAPLSAASGVAAAIGAAYTENFVGAAAALGSALDSVGRPSKESGGSGGMASILGDFHVYARFTKPVDADIAEHGRPLCQIRTLNTLSGYIQCRDGDISAPGTASELAQLESYLTGGFFYE